MVNKFRFVSACIVEKPAACMQNLESELKLKDIFRTYNYAYSFIFYGI
jgi:hypothetical protein